MFGGIDVIVLLIAVFYLHFGNPVLVHIQIRLYPLLIF